MTPRQIDRYFKTLDRLLARPAEIIVVGASAGALMGHIRPSFAIDFEIRLKGKKSAASRRLIAQAVEIAARENGVAVNYSENIGGGSRIHYLDYRKMAETYKKIGKLKVKIAAPAYWTIGKMARFLELDIQDMVQIIKKKKIAPEILIRIWARALNSSDLSLELGQFRDHVLYFLRNYGQRVWGRKFDIQRHVDKFQRLIR